MNETTQKWTNLYNPSNHYVKSHHKMIILDGHMGSKQIKNDAGLDQHPK